jgi:hypothetical protein
MCGSVSPERYSSDDVHDALRDSLFKSARRSVHHRDPCQQ